MPSAVIPRVSQFGTRRVCRSSAALVQPLAATAAMTTALCGTGNDTGERLPERRVDRRADRPHRDHRDDRDQRDEQTILDKILAVVTSADQSMNECENGIHEDLPFVMRPGAWVCRRRGRSSLSSYTADASLPWIVVKIVLTDPPARPMATTATSEIRPTSNAYSMRSCAS